MQISTADKIVVECNLLAGAAGFDDWRAMIQEARAKPELMASLVSKLPGDNLDALLPSALLSGLQQGLASSVAPIQPELIKEVLSLLDQLPADEAQLRLMLSQLSENGQRELLAVSKKARTIFSDSRKGLQEAVKQLPTARAGRLGINDTMRAEIVQQVKALHKGPPPLRKRDAVHQVATERRISDRAVWRILREQSAGIRENPN